MNAEVSPQLLVNIFEPEAIGIGGSFVYFSDVYRIFLKLISEILSTFIKKHIETGDYCNCM